MNDIPTGLEVQANLVHVSMCIMLVANIYLTFQRRAPTAPTANQIINRLRTEPPSLVTLIGVPTTRGDR